MVRHCYFRIHSYNDVDIYLFSATFQLRRGLSVKELFIAEEPPEQDFNDVVDMDDERMEDFVAKELVGTMIESFAFKMFIMALIVVNSVLIALQTDQQLVMTGCELC